MGGGLTIRLWDAGSGRELRRLARDQKSADEDAGFGAITAAVTFSPDGQLVAAAWNDGLISLWEAASGKERGEFPANNSPGPGPVAVAPDGKTLAWGTPNGMVRLR